MRVGDVTCGKHALDIGRGVVTREFDIALLVEVNLTAQELGVGTVANGEEEAVDSDVKEFLLVGALETHQVGTLYPIVTKQANGIGIE